MPNEKKTVLVTSIFQGTAKGSGRPYARMSYISPGEPSVEDNQVGSPPCEQFVEVADVPKFGELPAFFECEEGRRTTRDGVKIVLAGFKRVGELRLPGAKPAAA